jgi:hypothetical protein
MKKLLLVLLFIQNAHATTEVCFEIEASSDQEIEREIIAEFYGIFKDDQYCVNAAELEAMKDERQMTKILSAYEKIEINAYQRPPESSLSQYLPTASIVVGSVVLGNILNDKVLYPGEDDKTKHARVGGAISIGSTLGALYLAHAIPDEKLSPKLKKLLVGCSGFILSTLAGAGKEVYDSRHPQKHTKDVHDFYATAVGGGLGLGCSYSFKF